MTATVRFPTANSCLFFEFSFKKLGSANTTMIDHTGIRVPNFPASKAFYLKPLATLGDWICKERDDAVGFGAQQDSNDDPGGDFWLSAGQPHVPRTHVAFRANSKEQVNAFYNAALAAGGKDNGSLGLRPRLCTRKSCNTNFVVL